MLNVAFTCSSHNANRILFCLNKMTAGMLHQLPVTCSFSDFSCDFLLVIFFNTYPRLEVILLDFPAVLKFRE